MRKVTSTPKSLQSFDGPVQDAWKFFEQLICQVNVFISEEGLFRSQNN
jgi:hypothetical protein